MFQNDTCVMQNSKYPAPTLSSFIYIYWPLVLYGPNAVKSKSRLYNEEMSLFLKLLNQQSSIRMI